MRSSAITTRPRRTGRRRVRRREGEPVILTERDLAAAIADDRAQGRTIAFANGCFDLLHVGHVRYLRAAAEQADRLVVAINADRSVAALKGPGQPILPASERAELVDAID